MLDIDYSDLSTFDSLNEHLSTNEQQLDFKYALTCFNDYLTKNSKFAEFLDIR